MKSFQLLNYQYQLCDVLFIPVARVIIVIDAKEDDKIANLRDRMIKNMELCRGRISDLSK